MGRIHAGRSRPPRRLGPPRNRPRRGEARTGCRSDVFRSGGLLLSLVKVSRTTGATVVDRARSGAELVRHPNGVVSTTVARDGDSVQALVLLQDRDAPSSVTFDVQGELSQDDEGVITATTSNGTRWIAAPAWAKDAAGRSVPTRYEIQQGKIVQVVDHRSTDFTYPIVADPYLGSRLFGTVGRNTYRGDWRYNAYPTAWGAYVSTGPIGYSITKRYGWPEWVSAYSAITNKATLKQQFDCHALGASLGIIGDIVIGQWNLERVRSDRSNWSQGVTSHRCNW